jgi:hypothetical protein
VPGHGIQKRDKLLSDTLAGNLDAETFLQQRWEIQESDLQLRIDLESIPLFAAKLEMVEAVEDAGRTEAERLTAAADADARREMLQEKVSAFKGRAADREALLRSDEEIKTLKMAARAARNVGNQCRSDVDHAWWNGLQLRLRGALGLPVVDPAGRRIPPVPAAVMVETRQTDPDPAGE